MSNDPRGDGKDVGMVATVRARVAGLRQLLQRLLVWRVWERMLEIEFVDRGVALAGKAFISFFPMVIVVAAFLPTRMRTSIFTSLTTRLGLSGNALDLAKEAFTSADDVRRATGILGLVLTVFFATSFTTALQRVYLRAWRRPPGLKVGGYTRGLLWLVALLGFMAFTGGVARVLGDGVGVVLFVIVMFVCSVAWWWFSAWYLLLGQVRWRVLLPTGAVSALAMTLYAVSANVWMPNTVTENLRQFGFFGVALALVTWFSGAAICLIVGACVGPVLAEDPGPVGRLVRGPSDAVLVDGAPPSVGPPTREVRLRDAFAATSDDAS